jgi:hypothetical protein
VHNVALEGLAVNNFEFRVPLFVDVEGDAPRVVLLTTSFRIEAGLVEDDAKWSACGNLRRGS